MKALSIFRPRLIPVTILAASFLTGVKLVEAWTGTAALLGVPAAEAARPADNAPANLLPKGATSTMAGGTQLAAVQSAQGTTSQGTAGTEKDAPHAKAAGTAQEAARSPAALAAEPRDPSTYSKSEVEVLQDLAKRHDQLDARARDLDMRENVLAATEQKIDGKIAELKTLEGNIRALLKQRDAQNDKNLKSLVKVYENMKPQDAARIFENLDMSILLDVAGRMREAKLAQVLANMNPDKARSITTELATWRQTPALPGKSG